MRKNPGFKLYALFGLLSAALVSGACSDDEDVPPTDGAGTGGASGSAGSSSGKPSGGKSSAGSDVGGTNGDAGTATAGKGGNATAGTSTGGTSTAGTSTGGTTNEIGGAGNAGEPPAIGGESGAAGAAGAGGSEMGEGGEGGGGPVVYATLVNPGFELGTVHAVPTGWSNEGTAGAAYYESGGSHSGTGKLVHWTDWNADPTDYTARTYQTLEPIANGTYSFSLWVDRGDVKTAQYLFAKGHDVSDADLEVTKDTTDSIAPAGYVQITLSGIVVTSGKLTVGVYTANWAGNYLGFDDAALVME